VRVRIGVHSGEATLVGNEYLGLEVHRAARVASAGHGGQVLVSETTRALVDHALPPGLTLKDLGMHRLKDLARPERPLPAHRRRSARRLSTAQDAGSGPQQSPDPVDEFHRPRRPGPRGEAAAVPLPAADPNRAGRHGQDAPQPGDRGRGPGPVRGRCLLCPAQPVHDPELVASAIAQALAISTTGSRRPIDALLDYLREKQILVVLDNFEQLLEAAPIATQLLEGSAGLRVLVSSRTALRVSGEQEFPVPPLALPDLKALPSLAALSQFEAVRLFIERAVAVKPDFQATNENAPAIAGICERVDGLPLAIELAAARVKLFSPQALLSRLEKSLSALSSGARNAPARQQTLRGAILWSYDMLDAGARRLLARVSVFARGGNLEQLEPVCGPVEDVGGDVLYGLDWLADQSLLRRLPEFDEPRFLMLQTIRDFAIERLEESGRSGGDSRPARRGVYRAGKVGGVTPLWPESAGMARPPRDRS